MKPEDIVAAEVGRSVLRPEQLPEGVRSALARHHSDLVALVESLHLAGRPPEVIRSLVAQLLRRYEADLLAALEGQET